MNQLEHCEVNMDTTQALRSVHGYNSSIQALRSEHGYNFDMDAI